MAAGIGKQLSLRDFLLLITIAALGLAVSMERARWRSEFDKRIQLETKIDRIPTITDILITSLHQRHFPTSSTISLGGLIRVLPPERISLTNTFVTFQLVEAKTGKIVEEAKQTVALNGELAVPLPGSSAYDGYTFDVTNANQGLHLIYVTLFNGNEEIAKEIATIEIRERADFGIK